MTRKEYMEQLKKYLKRLPKEDYDNAIEYFSEYFDEAGPENEQQVMEELGQPKEAARELLLNLLQESVGDSKDITEEKTAALPAAGSYYGESSHAHSRTDSGNLSTTGYSTSAGKKRSPGKIILLAFLVICASPVSIALLFAGLAVLAAVVIVIAAVIFSMAVTGVSAIAGGIVLTGCGMTLIARSLAASCMMVGSGFLMAGAGILVGVLTIYICKWCAMGIGRLVNRLVRKKVNKIAKTVLMTGTALCAAGVVLSTAGYFAGGKDFTYTSDHMYVSGGNSSSRKNLTVMKKEQIDDFTKLNVDFEDFDLDIRTSDDDHYYMEYKLEKNGRKNPLTWKDKDGELTLEEPVGGSGSYYITYDLGIFSTHADLTEKKDALNTVVLYIPEKAQLSEAKLQLSDGDLAADQLLCKEMTLELLNGDLMLDKGEFEKFDAKLSDGDLNVKELQCTDNMQLKSGNGDVTIKKAELADGQIALSDGDIQIDNSSFNGDMKINSSCGDVSVEMKNGSAEKTNIYLKAADGDVDTEGLSRGKTDNEEDTSVYENKAGASAPTLNVECSDGDITLTESEK